MGSFCRLPGTSGCFPCPLSALEEHNFLFQLRGGEQPPQGAKEVSIGDWMLKEKVNKKQWEGKASGPQKMRGEPQVHTMFPFVSPTGPRSSPDCCGSVVHPKAALHPEHLHPLPVSLWDSPLDTILFTFVWQHTPFFPLSLLLACPASAWTAHAL